MLDELNEMLEMMINDERLMPNIAKLMRIYVAALVAEGFTEEQATKIASNYKPT